MHNQKVIKLKEINSTIWLLFIFNIIRIPNSIIGHSIIIYENYAPFNIGFKSIYNNYIIFSQMIIPICVVIILIDLILCYQKKDMSIGNHFIWTLQYIVIIHVILPFVAGGVVKSGWLSYNYSTLYFSIIFSSAKNILTAVIYIIFYGISLLSYSYYRQKSLNVKSFNFTKQVFLMMIVYIILFIFIWLLSISLQDLSLGLMSHMSVA